MIFKVSCVATYASECKEVQIRLEVHWERGGKQARIADNLASFEFRMDEFALLTALLFYRAPCFS
jgi:hypothetical protein